MFSNNIKSIKEYFSEEYSEIDELGLILHRIVAERGKTIYFQSGQLTEEMKKYGASETDIHRILLMTKVIGFNELIENRKNIQNNDLERYIHNAATTGFQREILLELTADIAFSIGITLENKISLHNKSKLDDAYVIPMSIYKKELDEFRSRFVTVKDDPAKCAALDLSPMEPLVRMGITKAKYYVGYCLMQDAISEKSDSLRIPSDKRGLNLLQEAASEGDREAAAALGDYYYNYNNFHAKKKYSVTGKAYDYYTRFGSIALTDTQKKNVKDILNQKDENSFMIKISAGFCVLLLCMVLLSSFILRSTHIVLGIISFIFEIGAVAAVVLHNKTMPYNVVSYLPITLYLIWFVYMAINFLI